MAWSPGTSKQTEMRAKWTLEKWTERPSLRYDQMTREICKAFEIGELAAQRVIKRTYELMKVRTTEMADRYLDTVLARALADEETARRRGDLRTANKIRFDTAKLFGLGAPEVIEHKHSRQEFEDLTDDELAVAVRLAGDDETAATEH